MCRYIRSIAWVMIMLLTVSPVLACNCIAVCAAKQINGSLHDSNMSGTVRCHKSPMNMGQTKSSTGHKNCSMGINCNFSQVVPIIVNAKFASVNLGAEVFLRSQTITESVDLSPPIKPPA